MYSYPQRLLAHRGGGKLAPENTIAALRCGLAHGYRAVEFDVMLARDGVPVVIHDPYLGRTVAGAGMVADYDSAELAAMDAGSWFGAAFAGEAVPTFACFGAFCHANAIWMNVEIKPAPGAEAATGAAVAAATAAMATAGTPLLSSFSETALAAARSAAPDLPRALLLDALPSDWLARARALDVVAVHIRHTLVDGALVEAIHGAGLAVFCYTVNRPARVRELFALGVDGLCTDRIDLIAPEMAVGYNRFL